MSDYKTEAYRRAYQATRGVVDGIVAELRWVIVVLAVFYITVNTGSFMTDDTDLNGWNRSGLNLHTDHGTGVQYLSTKDGALIPRIQESEATDEQ